ncbi:MAG: Nine-heme cytochrome C [Desulfovibrio sp.]|nr:Nine-heme cytochrome C [Desulfovibrio sp.]
MRNGTVLLLLAALALAGVVCLSAPGTAAAKAATLASTDSGAPSAIVMFPVSAKPNPKGTAMTPTVFNHLNHEKAVAKCETCHHTGDPVACSTCHTIEGKAEGNFVTMERAMHATHIHKRGNGTTPTSCVSCHEDVTRKRQECAGCHNIVVPRHDAAWCASCHNVTTSITPEQLQQGIDGTLSLEQRESLAADTVHTPKPTRMLTPMDGPYKVRIDALAEKYLPNNFTHRRHVSSLMEKIRGDKLARAFHNQPETLCSTCHHRSPLSATPPKCGSCHTKDIDHRYPDRPNLKAAYHLQCMGCHKAMNVGRPKNTDCTTCHKARQ